MSRSAADGPERDGRAGVDVDGDGHPVADDSNADAGADASANGDGDGDDAPADARGIDRSPAQFSASLALLSGLFGVLGAGLSALTAAVPGLVGLLLVAVGAFRGSRRALSAGVVVLLVAVLVAGVSGGATAGLLVGTLGALLAWDLGENAVTMGEQLGRAADTRRAELAHAASSIAVGAVGAGVVYGLYLVASGGQPLTALVFLLVGLVLLAVVLGE